MARKRRRPTQEEVDLRACAKAREGQWDPVRILEALPNGPAAVAREASTHYVYVSGTARLLGRPGRRRKPWKVALAEYEAREPGVPAPVAALQVARRHGDAEAAADEWTASRWIKRLQDRRRRARKG